jgi:hypothetical protein
MYVRAGACSEQPVWLHVEHFSSWSYRCGAPDIYGFIHL